MASTDGIRTKPPRSGRQAPPAASYEAPRIGFLGTILTECAFEATDVEALQALQRRIGPALHDLAAELAERGREVALRAEGFLGPDLFARPKAPRPSIRRLRRSVARSWLEETLAGRYDSGFSRDVRHRWLPILLADYREEHPAPILVSHFLDFARGLMHAWIFDEPADNLVPEACMFAAWNKALDVQRRLFGLDPRA